MEVREEPMKMQEETVIPSLFFLVNSSMEYGPLEAQKETKIAIHTPFFAFSTLLFVRLHTFRQFLIYIYFYF